MQYYVISPDGQKYGPADVPTLAQWAQEGRINPDTMLESAQDASRVPASSVPGILPQVGANPYGGQAQPGPFTTYQRPTGNYAGDNGQSDVTKAWIFGGIGFICCPIIFSVMAIIYGNNAMKKGHPQGQAAMIFGIVSLVVGMGIGVMLNMARFATIMNR